MTSLSRALCLGALLLAAPGSASGATSGAIAAPPPYHLAGGSDHLTLAGHSGRDDRRWSDHGRPDRAWPDRPRRWSEHRPWQPWPGARLRPLPWAGMHHALPPRMVERRLRRQHFLPLGPIERRHGLYLVRAIDPFGRRVLLAIDPWTGDILGRQRR